MEGIWNLKRLITLIILITITYSCQKENKLDGYYYYCDNDKEVYVEFYFKKDSIRAATDNESLGLTKWRAYKIEHDSLRFISFGHLPDSTALKINYLDNKSVLFTSKLDQTELYSFNSKINFNDSTEFWSGFNFRKNEHRCD